MSSHTAAQEAFGKLLGIMDELREKCPWDKEQTFDSIRHLSIEEIHELSEAILENNTDEIKKELGDILLHVVFYSKMASEKNWFAMTEVIDALCQKLIRRHPHIYGEVNAETADEVKFNWEQIKQKEKKGTHQTSFLSGVPASMPSLVKALRMQEKAAQTGFDWDNKEQVLAKVQEEWNEFETANSFDAKKEEFGDYLFALVNYARFEGINPDDALEMANKKFKRRFNFIENRAIEMGKTISDMPLEEMDEIWNEAKSLGL
jgi:MazG family protein